MSIITPARARIALVVLAFAGGFGGGVGTAALTQQPEVVTISEAVPSACVQAVQSATEAVAAERRVEQYTDKAAVLAGEVTLAVAAGDAEKMADALSPIAKHNEDEAGWREARDSAREAFRLAGDDCIAKHIAAEAAAER